MSWTMRVVPMRLNLPRLVGVLLTLCVGGVFGSPPANAAEADAQTGLLFVSSAPPGAYVFLDGTILGQTPLEPLTVAAGEHTVWFRSRPPGEFEPLPLPERTFW